MSRYELTISTEYVPDWGIVEGVREIFQNALDEQVRDKNNKMFFDYNKETKTIKIGNKLSVLDFKSLLIGSSSKREDDKQIGQHGEGYKIASMVLLRGGYSITIYNYTKKEIWRGKVVKSRRFGTDIIAFDVEKVKFWEKVPEQSLIFEIVGITEDNYKAIVEKNLVLQEKEKDLGKVYETECGTLLCEARFKGQIYVSGLYVCTVKDLDYGYDFAPNQVKLDRDRGLVDDFNLSNACSYVLREITDVDFLKGVVDSRDAKFLKYEHTKENSVGKLSDVTATEFFEENGHDAVPVSSQTEADRAVEQNFKPVIVSETRKALIAKSSVVTSIPVPMKVKTKYEELEEFVNGMVDRMTEEEKAKKDRILKGIRNSIIEI